MGRIQIDTNNISRKNIIVEKSAALFIQKGYKATSMREIAEAVGVEASSLYNHIHNKSELLHIICFGVANHYMDIMNKVAIEKISSLQKIEKLLRFHITTIITQYHTCHVAEHEWKHLDEPYLSNYQTQRRIYRQRFAAIIEEGIVAKEIKQVDPPTAVLILLHSISGIESWHRSKTKITGKQLEENMISILIDGIKKQ